MKLHHQLLIAGAAAILTTLTTLVVNLDWSAKGPTKELLVMMGWPLVPLVAMTACGWFFRGARAALIACLAGLVSGFGVMAFLYVYAFHIAPDPQGGLILIFGPLYASAVMVPFGLVAIGCFVRRKMRGAQGNAVAG